MEFRGEETTTLELLGALALPTARGLVPSALALEEADGRAVVGLLLFQMRGLGLRGVPGPSFDYSEALWRIGVVVDGQPAWFAVACDLDHLAVRAMGRLMIRYPTRAAAIAWTAGDSVTLEVGNPLGAFHVSARPEGSEVASVPPRRAFVGGGSLYEVPWREEPAPFRRVASVEVLDDSLTLATLGEVSWRRNALLHRGRIHRCGLARPHR